MNISIIDKKDICLKVENSTIKFDNIKLPYKMADTLIISSNVKIDTKDLIKITNNGISIILLNNFSNQSTILTSTNQKNAELKLQQYEALSKKVKIAKYLIHEKIKRHTHQLRLNKIIINQDMYLEKLEKRDKIEDILGIEGSFAKEYFKNYFTLFSKKWHNGKRTKRPPLDPLNALLSYFYYLLYNIIAVKLMAYGFEPSIAFLHAPFRSHLALSSDMMELFRDKINQFVKIIIDENIVEIEDFSKKGGVYIKYSGKQKLYKPLKDLWSGLEPKINHEISNLRSML
jgi:CRISPR-associated protein Cas1